MLLGERSEGRYCNKDILIDGGGKKKRRYSTHLNSFSEALKQILQVYDNKPFIICSMTAINMMNLQESIVRAAEQQHIFLLHLQHLK